MDVIFAIHAAQLLIQIESQFSN